MRNVLSFLTVRYAVQLLTPSNLLARINGKYCLVLLLIIVYLPAWLTPFA